MTVSRALSNKRYVSARSRKLILVAANELDYQIKMMERQFSSNRPVLPGMIAPFRGLLRTHYFG
jgi:DNA-binding LacI/PurR family transcriptional regulator